MANFFTPTTGSPLSDANNYAISKLNVMQGGTAKFGLWGGDELGNRLIVKVVRGGSAFELKNGWDAKLQAQVSVNQSKQSAVVTIFTIGALRRGDAIQAYAIDGRPSCGLAINVVPESQGVMAEWNQLLSDPPKLQAFLSKNSTLYSEATPYLKWSSGVTLKSHGGLLSSVNGLAVHTTGNGKDKKGHGVGPTTDANLVAWRCLSTWNANGASAHFAISGTGTVAQFVPCNRVANAQRSGNPFWLSVEIDNDGVSEMTPAQMDALQNLYRWVQTEFSVPPSMATGWLPKGAPAFDSITTDICDKTTTDLQIAIASKGLSCHWWLDGPKGANAHACPGKGILAQLPAVLGG